MQDLAVDEDLAAEPADLRGERLTDRTERSAWVTQLLLRRAAPAQLAPQTELRPEPGEWHAFAVGAELPQHERPPHRRQRALAACVAEPIQRADVVHALPVGPGREPQHRIPESESVDDR